MSEYELATLSVHHAALWVATGQLAIGVGQILIVWYGIGTMRRAGDQRDRHHNQRHTEAMDLQRGQHTEAMATLDLHRTALETLIARTAHPNAP